VTEHHQQCLTVLAKNIKKLRSELKISQETLADSAGIDRTYASQIERGLANPSLGVLVSISLSLETTIVELLS
jgi:transcriptional regulator with XRE-family HTH domain